MRDTDKCARWSIYKSLHKSEVGDDRADVAMILGGRYKAAKFAAQPHTLAQSVGPGRRSLGEGLRRFKGVVGSGINNARSFFFTDVGHARPRPKRLAEKLLQIREALGLSQREMAERLGVERRYNIISRYERGKSVPYIEVVLAYARAANVEMAQIIDDDLDLTF
jgi:DNA-binding XRE family transcriptional regulator